MAMGLLLFLGGASSNVCGRDTGLPIYIQYQSASVPKAKVWRMWRRGSASHSRHEQPNPCTTPLLVFKLHLPRATMHGDEALLLSFSSAGAVLPSQVEPVFSDRNVAIEESSLLEEIFDDDELVGAKEGRGLRLGVCCVADAKYDAGLNERLTIFGDYLVATTSLMYVLSKQSRWEVDQIRTRNR
jgi:hypothetical protein